MVEPDESRTVTRAMVIAVVIMVAYWALWFGARSTVASDTTKAYYDFENAFPLADGWLTVCLLGAIVSLRRRSPFALFWLLAGGGAGVYLFALDVLYDIEHGVWFANGGGVIELGINAVTIMFSVSLLRWGWSRRFRLLGGDAST